MKKTLLTIPTLALIAVIGFSGNASAANVAVQVTAPTPAARTSAEVNADVRIKAEQMKKDAMNRGAIFGTVTAVNGTTITILSKDTQKTGDAQVSYTVNASAAVVDKNNDKSSASAIAVGDNVMVEGTVTGTTISAVKIHNGVMAKGALGTKPEGNGQPIVGGTVTAVNGNTITISNKSNVAYTVDITNAKVTKNGTASANNTIVVGDTVLAQGTVNGTAVTAASVISTSANASANANAEAKAHMGFFAKIGNFFARLFGKN